MAHDTTPASLLAGKTIVTVEDEGVVQLQLRKILTRAGMRVVGQAYNGQAGVELVLREQPDLVTMDITMPVMDGITATRRIMERWATCVVVLTAYPDEAARARAQEAGAQGYLVKPIIANILIPALERVYTEKCSASEGREEP